MDKKPYRCSQAGCTSAFSRPGRLAQHILGYHSKQKAFKCDQCSRSYTNNSHLIRHVRSSHQVPEKDVVYSCPTCLKTYSYRQNLKKHIKRTHMKKDLFICDICKKHFRKKNQLNAHMYYHTGVKAFRCHLCIQDFITLYDRRKHMRNHKTYTCKICDLQFVLWSKYVKHNKNSHAQKEFICDHCDRSFKQRVHIIRHLKQHMQLKSKQFSCPYENCKRVYSRNSNLRQHILIKHMKMLHECTICNTLLSTKTKLTLHMKRHEASEVKTYKPKTKAEGRKERKDIGIPKTNVAVKLTGYTETEDTPTESSVQNNMVEPMDT